MYILKCINRGRTTVQKYQVIDTIEGWTVVNTRTNKNLKSFNSGNEHDDKDAAFDYVQGLIEDDRWHAMNRD